MVTVAMITMTMATVSMLVGSKLSLLVETYSEPEQTFTYFFDESFELLKDNRV